LKKILTILIAVLLITPAVLLAQGDVGIQKITEAGLLEKKPQAFYYEIDPYQPIGILLGTNRYILDDNLITQVEKAVGRSTFMADPNLLRFPVSLNNFYDLDKEALTLDVSRYQERGVSAWEVQVLDARGMTFRTLKGTGSLPASISWDGRGDEPTEVMAVGDIYSFIVFLTMRDGSDIRKIGRPIEVNGVAYDSIVAVKEIEVASYEPVVTPKIARYYLYVLNRLKEKNYSYIKIRASSMWTGQSIADYLSERLYNVKIDVEEDPEYARVEFVFSTRAPRRSR